MKGHRGEPSRDYSRRFYPEVIAVIVLVSVAWAGAVYAFI
jgi:hypothetical protein